MIDRLMKLVELYLDKLVEISISKLLVSPILEIGAPLVVGI